MASGVQEDGLEKNHCPGREEEDPVAAAASSLEVVLGADHMVAWGAWEPSFLGEVAG